MGLVQGGSASPAWREPTSGDLSVPSARPRSAAARALRTEVAGSEVPIALYLAAGFVAAAGAVEFAISGVQDADAYAGAALVAVALSVLGLVTQHVAAVRSRAAWVFAAGMLLTAGWLIQLFLESPGTARTGYVAVILMSLGPVILEWLPWLASSVVITTASVAAAGVGTAGQQGTWLTVCVVAMAVGAILLFLRRRSLAAIAEARQLAEDRAITDTLTGLLNRTGVQAMVPGLWATAHRLSQPVVVAFVDVDGLKAANDAHGHDFGDEVLTTVADALRATVRQGDVIARWGGDEFIVVGMGIEPSAAALDERLMASIRGSGIDLARWPGHVSVGTAHGMPQGTDIHRLITEADERMYEGRRRRRAAEDA